MIALGSGEPTKAICSTLIARAFQSIRYPILPQITQENAEDADCDVSVRSKPLSAMAGFGMRVAAPE